MKAYLDYVTDEQCVETVSIVLDQLGSFLPFKNFDHNNEKYRKLHQRCSDWFSQHIEKEVKELCPISNSAPTQLGSWSEHFTSSHLSALMISLKQADDTSIASLADAFVQ